MALPPAALQWRAEVPDLATNDDLGLARHIDEIRFAFYSFAGADAYPVRSRLYFMARCAVQTDPLFNQAEGRFDQSALEEALIAFGAEEVKQQLHEHLQPALARIPPAIGLVVQALGRCMRHSVLPAFRAVVDEVVDSYGADPQSGVSRSGEGADLELGVEPALLLAAYQRRRDRVLARPELAARVELYLRNYLRAFWIKDWYVHSSTLGRHVDSLLVRVALLRFLLLGHPAAAEATEGGDVEALDRLAVRVFYSLSRAIEHSPGFLGSLAEAPSMERLAGLLVL